MTAGTRIGRSRSAGDSDPVTPGQPTSDDSPMPLAAGRPWLARFAFAAVASLFVGCLIVQVFLVGLDIFADAEASIHRDFAYVYGWLTPVLILLAGFAEAPKTTRQLTIILVVLFAIQIVLPSLRHVVPIFAALHPVNALAIFAVAMVVARQAIDLFRTIPSVQQTEG
jgi:hypothetical protein